MSFNFIWDLEVVCFIMSFVVSQHYTKHWYLKSNYQIFLSCFHHYNGDARKTCLRPKPESNEQAASTQSQQVTPLFWTSGYVCPGFQSQVGSPCLGALLPACNRILRFTSGATPADLLITSMVAELFSSTYL